MPRWIRQHWSWNRHRLQAAPKSMPEGRPHRIFNSVAAQDRAGKGHLECAAAGWSHRPETRTWQGQFCGQRLDPTPDMRKARTRPRHALRQRCAFPARQLEVPVKPMRGQWLPSRWTARGTRQIQQAWHCMLADHICGLRRASVPSPPVRRRLRSPGTRSIDAIRMAKVVAVHRVHHAVGGLLPINNHRRVRLRWGSRAPRARRRASRPCCSSRRSAPRSSLWSFSVRRWPPRSTTGPQSSGKGNAQRPSQDGLRASEHVHHILPAGGQVTDMCHAGVTYGYMPGWPKSCNK